MLFTDISHERAVRAFKKAGFWVSHGKKHTGMTNGTQMITIPRHSSINPYTLKKVIKAAGLTDAEFKALL